MLLNIRPVQNLRERRLVTRFRYDCYLQRFHQAPGTANPDTRAIEELLDDDGIIWVAWDDGEIIGQIRQNLGDMCRFGRDAQRYGMPQFVNDFPDRCSLTSAPLVRPPDRNNRLARNLTRVAHKIAFGHGIQLDFAGADAENKSFLEQLGYMRSAPDFVDQNGHTLTPMVLPLSSMERRSVIRSAAFSCAASELPRVRSGVVAA